MAELGLSIAGAVLAWKNVVACGELIAHIMDDDSKCREGQFIRLKVSQFMLKDWGDYWGVDRGDGKFHGFEPQRKELIMAVIFRLRDSRGEALRKLREHYGLSDDGEKLDAADARRFSRTVDRIKGATSRLKGKGRWLIYEQEVVQDLVKETLDLHQCLQYLTYGSGSFVSDTMASIHSLKGLEATVAEMEIRGQELRQEVQRDCRLHSTCNSPTRGNNRHKFDGQTLASYAAKSMTCSNQASLFQTRINEAAHFHGDSRIPETVSEWWNYESPGVLILEATDIVDDDTAGFTSATMYYLARCHKMMYSFGNGPRVDPVAQFSEMLRIFIRYLVSLDGSQALSQVTLPTNFSTEDLEDGPADENIISRLVVVFHGLLGQLARTYDQRILVAIDGLEQVFYEDSTISEAVQSFVARLGTVSSPLDGDRRALVKALLCCKGHATGFQDHLGESDICDVTDNVAETTNILQELSWRI